MIYDKLYLELIDPSKKSVLADLKRAILLKMQLLYLDYNLATGIEVLISISCALLEQFKHKNRK